MRRSITLENMEAITNHHSVERTEARWRRTRGRMLRVLLYVLLITGGVKLCALSRDVTTIPPRHGDPLESGSRAPARGDPLA